MPKVRSLFALLGFLFILVGCPGDDDDDDTSGDDDDVADDDTGDDDTGDDDVADDDVADDDTGEALWSFTIQDGEFDFYDPDVWIQGEGYVLSDGPSYADISTVDFSHDPVAEEIRIDISMMDVVPIPYNDIGPYIVGCTLVDPDRVAGQPQGEVPSLHDNGLFRKEIEIEGEDAWLVGRSWDEATAEWIGDNTTQVDVNDYLTDLNWAFTLKMREDYPNLSDADLRIWIDYTYGETGPRSVDSVPDPPQGGADPTYPAITATGGQR